MKMKVKRLLDFLIASLFLIFFLPIIIFSSILIIIFDKQNPLFKQKRSGKDGFDIHIFKLSTMKSKNDKKYVTNLGNILRISKIDELPQLFNVICGSLSLVGPRPLYTEFNKYLSSKHKLRLDIKPGITGLAQIKMRDSTNWNKKFNYDVFYVKHYSITFDFYIMYQTLIMLINVLTKKEKKIIESNDYLSDFYKNYKK